jgi:hypothetical protein
MKYIRTGIYTKKVHLWLTEDQWEKTKEDAIGLRLKQIEVIRRAIERKYPYVTYLLGLMKLVKNQGNLLNQIARMCNSKKSVDEEMLKLLREVAEGNQEIVKGIKRL